MVQKQTDICNGKEGAGSPKYSKNHNSTYCWVPHDESPKYREGLKKITDTNIREDPFLSPMFAAKTRNNFKM